MSHQEDMSDKGLSTKSIHFGKLPNTFGALTTPIYQTSTFVFEDTAQAGRLFSGQEEGYVYTRMGHPNATEVERKVAMLEHAEDCVATCSGMAAITATLWTALAAGDHVVASSTLYGATHAFLLHGMTRYGVQVSLADTRDPKSVEKALKPNTKVVYLESPANPNMFMADIKEIAAIAHKANPEILVMVDNTYSTPLIQRPLELGADVSIHSATKYLNGHGDVIAGFVVGHKRFIERVRNEGIKLLTGGAISPFEAFLICRGLKTFPMRMKQHCENAQKVAEFLEQHPAVDNVQYPGLPSFAQYELAKRQMSMPGAMIAFEVKGGIEAGKKLLDSVKLVSLAVSLGDAETLIQHPASMTHLPCSAKEREEAHITDGLIRLSVGLEDVEDIIADLKQALDLL